MVAFLAAPSTALGFENEPPTIYPAEDDAFAQVGQNTEDPQSTSQFYRYGDMCSNKNIGKAGSDFCGPNCLHCMQSLPATETNWRSSNNVCRCAPPQRPALEYVYDQSTSRNNDKGFCSGGCPCMDSWPKGETPSSPEFAKRCAPANANFV